MQSCTDRMVNRRLAFSRAAIKRPPALTAHSRSRAVYAPTIELLGVSRATTIRTVCFADPSFQRLAFRNFDARKAVARMVVILNPNRLVRVPRARVR